MGAASAAPFSMSCLGGFTGCEKNKSVDHHGRAALQRRVSRLKSVRLQPQWPSPSTDCIFRSLFSRCEEQSHSMCKDRKSSVGSVNEHDPNETAKLWRAAAISSRLSRC